MKKHLIACVTGVALIAGLSVTAYSAPLKWDGRNIANDKTIALFHFNEGAGTVSQNEVDMPGIENDGFDLATADLWAANPTWLTTPSGYYLDNVASITRDQDGNITDYTLKQTDAMAVSQSQLPIDWENIPGITISFWMRDEIATPTTNRVLYMGFGGWRNQQATFSYRPGFNNSGHLRMDGVATPDVSGQRYGSWYNTWRDILHDGEWHHVAMTWDATTDTARLYIDNQLIQLAVVNDVAVFEWSTDGGFQEIVSEFWHLGWGINNVGFGGAIDELLIQGEVLTDFSQPIPEPASLALLGLGGLLLAGRRRCGR